MHMKVVFTAEISQDVAVKLPAKTFTNEEEKKIVEDALREICEDDAVIIVHDCKVTREADAE